MSKAHQLIQEDEHYFAKSGRIKYYPLVIDAWIWSNIG